MTGYERPTRCDTPKCSTPRWSWAHIGVGTRARSVDRRSDLLKRALGALITLPIVLLFVWLGGWWFFGFLLLTLSAATWEYVYMLRRSGYRPAYPFAICAIWVILAGLILGIDVLRPALAVLLLASMCWHVLVGRSSTRVEDWLLPIAGALYIGWLGGHSFLLRALPLGLYRLSLVLALTMMSDVGAYFVGRTWGRRRLAPLVSPGKTWEGLLGGIAAALVTGPILGHLVGMGWRHGAILGLLLSSLTPLGDLGMSMIKRQVGVKNTGNLIPGHGGILDRIDSHLVGVVVGYYYFTWVIRVLSER